MAPHLQLFAFLPFLLHLLLIPNEIWFSVQLWQHYTQLLAFVFSYSRPYSPHGTDVGVLNFWIIWIEFSWIAIRSADGSLSLEPWVFSVLVFGEADRPPAFQLTPSSAELAALTSITAEHRIASAMSTNYHGWGFWFSHFLFYLVDYIHMCHVLLSTSCLCLFPPTPFPVHLS